MTKVGDIINAIEDWAPPSLAETWDNPGLMTGDPDASVKRIIITLDVTGQSIRSASEIPDTLIIAHHPVIFTPLKKLSGNNRPLDMIREAIRNNISIYTAHTNLDRAPGGVSSALAEQLGLRHHKPLVTGIESMKFVVFAPPEYTTRILEAAAAAGAGLIGEYSHCSFSTSGYGTFLPTSDANPFSGERGTLSRENEDRLEMIVPAPFADRVVRAARRVHPYEEMAYDLIPLSNTSVAGGYGVIGDMETPLERTDFLKLVADRLHLGGLRASRGGKEMVSRIAVLGGSGSHFIQTAVDAGADAYLTGELGHHDYLDYGDMLLLVDGGHRATELPVLKVIETRLRTSFAGITIECDWGNSAYDDFHF